MNTVLVSICVQTYQHAGYIRECLDGILSQVTDFDYEILLGEDCSTDGTREICVEYADRYRDKISLFLHDRKDNIKINGRPSGRRNLLTNLEHARGRYFAICEGDDYWTDTDKLSRQVSMMESHQEYAITFHPVRIRNDNEFRESFIREDRKGSTTIRELARRNYIYTCSSLYRNRLPDSWPDFFYQVPFLDYVLHMYMAQFGKIKYLPQNMAVYREHQDGIWSSMQKTAQLSCRLQVVNALKSYFDGNPEVSRQLNKQHLDYLIELMELYREEGKANEMDKWYRELKHIDPSLLLELFDELRDENERLHGKLHRLLNHPIAGTMIRILATLKRDPEFSRIK